MEWIGLREKKLTILLLRISRLANILRIDAVNTYSAKLYRIQADPELKRRKQRLLMMTPPPTFIFFPSFFLLFSWLSIALGDYSFPSLPSPPRELFPHHHSISLCLDSTDPTPPGAQSQAETSSLSAPNAGPSAPAARYSHHARDFSSLPFS